jgi:hypothetical protein
MRHASLELPPRYRQQALARLDGLIARAERDLERRLAGAGRSAASAGTARLAEGRLDLLRHSRRCLLTGEPPTAGASP